METKEWKRKKESTVYYLHFFLYYKNTIYPCMHTYSKMKVPL